MELEVKKGITLEEGPHNGECTEIKYREEPYEYTDIYVKIDGTDITIKTSVPTNLSPNSKMYALLNKFTNLEEGDKVDPEKILVGKKLSFVTVNTTNKNGTFANILVETIKPRKWKKWYQ